MNPFKLAVPLLLPLVFTPNAFAYTCFFTAVKDSCWTDYNLDMSVTSAATGKAIMYLHIPKGKSYVRQQFKCTAGESFNFSAHFSPIFWQSDAGKQFLGKRTWTLPQAMEKGHTAWSVTVCYPEQFSEVPLPPKAGSNCTCDYKSIPPVVPPKKP